MNSKKGLKINGNLIVLVIALVVVIGVFSLLNHNYFTTVNTSSRSNINQIITLSHNFFVVFYND